MNNYSLYLLIIPIIICVFVRFSRIFLLRILIFKGLTARRLYKSFGVKELILERISLLDFGHHMVF
jgi:hypothetical protein